MKKLVVFIIVLILIAAGWAAASWVVGGRVEKRYFELLEQNARWGPMTLSNENYQRGILCSRAVTLLEMTVPGDEVGEYGEREFETVRAVFEHSLHHGPVPLAAGPGGRQSLSPALALVETRLTGISSSEGDLEDLLADIPELRDSVSRVRIDFAGAADGVLSVPSFEKGEDNVRFTFGGIEAATRYDPGNGALVGAMDLPRMELQAEDGSMVWDGIRGDFDLVEVLPLLFVGKSGMVVGSLSIDVPDKSNGGTKTFRMRELEVSSDSSIDQGMVRIAQVVRFEGGTLDGESYGPMIVDLEADNLDGAVLSDFQTQVRKTYRNAESADPDSLAAEIVPLYADLFARLLRGKPELNLKKFYLATPEGEADGTVRLKFTGFPEGSRSGSAEVKDYLRQLDSSADISVDESLVRALLAANMKQRLETSPEASEFSEKEIDAMVDRQLESQLEALEIQNFIVREEGRIRTRATFKNGKLVMNGQPMPIFRDDP